MSSPTIVLITGGNGFIGYAVIAGALAAGVRMALDICQVLSMLFLACFPLPQHSRVEASRFVPLIFHSI